MRKKRDTFTHLLCYRTITVAIGWIERLVIAERTPAPPNFPVAVGTGKPCINCYLLHLAPEDTTQIAAELFI